MFAGGGAARFENHNAQAGFLEKPGGEQAGDAGADERDVSAFVPVSCSRGAKALVFAQRDSIKKHPIIPFFGLTVPGIPVPYTPRKQRDNEKCKQGMTAPPIYAIL